MTRKLLPKPWVLMVHCKPAKKLAGKGWSILSVSRGISRGFLAKAVESGEFDTVLVPLNVVTRQALEELLPAAKAHDVGVVVMKPLSAKTSTLITCLYQPRYR